MARTIDKDYLLTHKRKVRFFGIGPDDESWGYAVPVEVIENAPTLTPPNEPLTLEQLRASPHGKIKDSTLQSICNRANEIACRPPEGEEDHHG